MTEQKHTAESIMEEMFSISPVKRAMNTAFAESVLMFAVMDIKKNGVTREEDYMTPMLTAITALKNEFSEDELVQMMSALASVCGNVLGGTMEIEA